MEEDILKGKTLLVVDDEVDLRDIVASELEFMGAKVFQAENILKAQKILSENKIDLIISDIRMPGGTGIDLLEVVKAKIREAPPVILITGFADITLEDAFDKGAEALLNKPFKLDDLIKMVVRYTAPIDERFLGPVESPALLNGAKDDIVYFGRGGMAIDITNQGRKYDIGAEVHFTLHNGGEDFEGKGVCRWIKLLNSHQVFMGLEFISLKEESLNQFKKLIDGKSVIPYIPTVRS